MSFRKLSFVSLLVVLFAVIVGVSAGHAAQGNYTQELYSYEMGPESQLIGPSLDWRGQYYHLKRNASRTVSYIFQNYGPSNNTNPFITINGDVESFEVTSDANASYVYYKLRGDGATLYRLPLVRGAGSPESRTFTFDGTTFTFESFTLAQNPDEFLLCSAVDSSLNVTVGLFSFDGGTEPARRWTGALPQEWRNNFTPLSSEDKGYAVVFEAATGTVWLTAQKSFRNSSQYSVFNMPWWFMRGDISSSGALSPYDPSIEIPGWNSGNMKLLAVGRYGRLVRECDGDVPDVWLSIREFDPATRQYKEGALTTWTDNGAERPIAEFFTHNESLSAGNVWWYSVVHDGQGNIYLGYNHVYTSGLGVWQRFAIFSPIGSSVVGTPAPDPSAKDGAVFRPENVTLKSSLPALPPGTVITGSRWEIYTTGTTPSAAGAIRTASAAPVYVGHNSGDSATHTVAQALAEGSYMWRVAYDWERAGAGDTVQGSTKWSDYAQINVSSSQGGGSSGGGCSAGVGALALLLAGAAMFAGKKR
jgi:hypothetical protein